MLLTIQNSFQILGRAFEREKLLKLFLVVATARSSDKNMGKLHYILGNLHWGIVVTLCWSLVGRVMYKISFITVKADPVRTNKNVRLKWRNNLDPDAEKNKRLLYFQKKIYYSICLNHRLLPRRKIQLRWQKTKSEKLEQYPRRRILRCGLFAAN